MSPKAILGSETFLKTPNHDEKRQEANRSEKETKKNLELGSALGSIGHVARHCALGGVGVLLGASLALALLLLVVGTRIALNTHGEKKKSCM